MRKEKRDAQIRLSNCCRGGIAEFYDDEYRLLWSVQSDEECLSLDSNIKGSGQINDKWMKEIVFFGMIIIPAYQFSALLDMFIFNSMHFWTGESPIKASGIERDDTKVTTLGETTIRWTPSGDGATVTYEQDGVVKHRATIMSSATGYRLVDENGSLLSEAEYGIDDSVRLLDGDCRVINKWNRKELTAIAETNSRKQL